MTSTLLELASLALLVLGAYLLYPIAAIFVGAAALFYLAQALDGVKLPPLRTKKADE